MAPVTFAPAGAMTPSAEFLFNVNSLLFAGYISKEAELYSVGISHISDIWLHCERVWPN